MKDPLNATASLLVKEGLFSPKEIKKMYTDLVEQAQASLEVASKEPKITSLFQLKASIPPFYSFPATRRALKMAGMEGKSLMIK